MGATFVFQLLILAILHTVRENSVLSILGFLHLKCSFQSVSQKIKTYNKVIKKENNHQSSVFFFSLRQKQTHKGNYCSCLSHVAEAASEGLEHVCAFSLVALFLINEKLGHQKGI